MSAPTASATTRATSRSRAPSEPGRLADDRAGRPTARDRPGSRPPAPAGRRRRTAEASPSGSSSEDRRERVAAGPLPAGGQLEGPAEDAVAGRHVDQPERTGDVGAGDGARHEPVAAGLPDRDEVVAVGVADRADGGLERLVGVVERVDRPDDGRRDRQVEMVALGVERVGAIERPRTPRGAGRRSAPRRPGRPSGGRPTCPAATAGDASTAPVSAAARKRWRSPSR